MFKCRDAKFFLVIPEEPMPVASERKRSLRTTVEVKKREGFISSGFPAALKDSFEVRHLAVGPLAQVQEKTPETITS